MLPRTVSCWLMVCFFMVLAMIVVGAITRLTDSGLSMVEWRPIYGFLPPLDEKEWQRIFSLYKKIPEYRLQNFGMSLEDFKRIFWWEYVHRLWGRMIGIVYAVPLAVFWWRGLLPRRWKIPLFILLLLGGLQGLIGWWMVKSGLQENWDVSAFRLMIHLGVALLIMVFLWVFVVLGNSVSETVSRETLPSRLGKILLPSLWILSFVTILSGALVAGNDAGLVYNDWPWMNGRFVPEDYAGQYVTAWVTDRATVQFHHRLFAYGLAFLTCILVFIRRTAITTQSLGTLWVFTGVLFLQIVLGIFTVLSVADIYLAILHHTNALFLLLSITHLVLIEIRRIKIFVREPA